MTQGGMVCWYRRQTSEGHISAVSTPPIARVGSFFSIFRDLQDFLKIIQKNANFFKEFGGILSKICKKLRILTFFFANFAKFFTKFFENLAIFWMILRKSCRSRKMLKNEPTLAIVAVHTAENEPLKILGVIHFNFQFGP